MTTPQNADAARRYVVEANALDTTEYIVFDEHAGTDELRDEPVYIGTPAECDAVANALNALTTPASAGARDGGTPASKLLGDLCIRASTLLKNVGSRDWTSQTDNWRTLASTWLDDYRLTRNTIAGRTQDGRND